MPPCGEALGNIGLDADGEKARKPRTGHGEEHRCDGTGAQIGDNKEGRKEDERRAEVPDESEGDDAEGREADEGIEVIAAVELVERRSAGVDIADLDKL